MRIVRYPTFDDPALEVAWGEVSARRPPDVFMSLGWQRAWWRSHGRGELLILVAMDGTHAVAIAPLFLDGGMLFLVGSGASDRLDVLGESTDLTLALLLEAAMDAAPGCIGVRLYHLPEESPSVEALAPAAERTGLALIAEGAIVDPALHLPTDGSRAAGKQSLVRHERGLVREGDLVLHDIRTAEEAGHWLPAFFEQHAARRSALGDTSRFADDPRERRFFEELAVEGGAAGWLRMLVLEWAGRPVAFHVGTRFGDTYLYYKPSFDVSLARRSPGEALLRRIILAAQAEGAEWLDLGIGDEPYKRRFTSVERSVRTFGLYPPSVLRGAA